MESDTLMREETAPRVAADGGVTETWTPAGDALFGAAFLVRGGRTAEWEALIVRSAWPSSTSTDLNLSIHSVPLRPWRLLYQRPNRSLISLHQIDTSQKRFLKAESRACT